MDGIADLSPQTRTIRTENHPDCPLCGALGSMLYEGLRDRLFDVPGTWGFRRCPNTNCRHVWLDPQPIAADLPLIYEKYYTHDGKDVILARALRPFLASALRWPLKLLYRLVLELSGLSHQRRRAYGMYLDGRTPGRLLEIGCGSGERLAHFAEQGWQVVGQDVDPKAADNAQRTYGVHVHLGPVESLPASLGTFDAVVMNHVIEHVSDPVDLLRQAATRMAPGGVLVAVTPNIDSFGHRRFKVEWRGLEPPRHLHLFLPRTLAQVARQAGLNDVRVITSVASAEGIAARSAELARQGWCCVYEPPDFLARLVGAIFQFAALGHHAVDRNSGDECILLATLTETG